MARPEDATRLAMGTPELRDPLELIVMGHAVEPYSTPKDRGEGVPWHLRGD